MIRMRKKLMSWQKWRALSSQVGKFGFSSDMLNVRIPQVDPHTGKKTDELFFLYDNAIFSAYLLKRHLVRSQVWPKVHILQGTPREEEAHLQYQELFPLKKLISDDLMQKIIEKDPTLINSAFIISLFSEESFKELIDSYCQKVLVCGKAPSSEQQNKVEENALESYRAFYFGERISPLEKEIEGHYLASKQEKFTQRQRNNENKQDMRCVWRKQDQRLLEDMVNWPQADFNLSDLNFRNYYEPLRLKERLPYAKQLFILAKGFGFMKTLEFNFNYKYEFGASESVFLIADKMFARTLQYTHSLEFSNKLEIPADYAIQLCISNMHIWLLTKRLRSLNTKVTRRIAEELDIIFKYYFISKIGTLHLTRQLAFQKNFQRVIDASTQALNYHFREENTHLYLNIDALVWSCIFMEKVERYGDLVYHMSEYLVKNWQSMQTLTEEDFIDGICDFDVYLCRPDFTSKITDINPPMDPIEFEKEFNENKPDKAYYYITKEASNAKEIKMSVDKNKQNYSLLYSLFTKLAHFIKKYLKNADDYDAFSEMDEQKKKNQKMQKKSPWKVSSHTLSSIDEEFDRVKAIRRSYRNSSNLKENRKQKQ